MVTLLEIFDRKRDGLRRRLGDHAVPAMALPMVREALESLLASYCEENAPGPHERRMAALVVDCLKAVVAARIRDDGAGSLVHGRESARAPMPARGLRRRPAQVLRVSVAVALIAVLGWDGAYLPLALLGVLFLLEAWRYLRGEIGLIGQGTGLAHRDCKPEPCGRWSGAGQDAPSGGGRRMDTDLLLDGLAGAIVTADKLLDESHSCPLSETAKGLDEDQTLLGFFQDLVGAVYAGDGLFALKKSRTVPYLLEQHGIRVESFREADSMEGRRCFDIEMSLDPLTRTPRTLKPALFKGDRCLRRGLVAEPARQVQDQKGPG